MLSLSPGPQSWPRFLDMISNQATNRATTEACPRGNLQCMSGWTNGQFCGKKGSRNCPLAADRGALKNTCGELPQVEASRPFGMPRPCWFDKQIEIRQPSHGANGTNYPGNAESRSYLLNFCKRNRVEESSCRGSGATWELYFYPSLYPPPLIAFRSYSYPTRLPFLTANNCSALFLYSVRASFRCLAGMR